MKRSVIKNEILLLALLISLPNSIFPKSKKTHVYNKKTFFASYNDPNTKNKDTLFIKSTFKKKSTILDRVEYTQFLKSYLEKFILPKLPNEETVIEEAEKMHIELVKNYLKLKEEKEDYKIADAIHDISLGNLLVYVDVNNSGDDDEGDAEAGDDKMNEEEFLADNGMDGGIDDL